MKKFKIFTVNLSLFFTSATLCFAEAPLHTAKSVSLSPRIEIPNSFSRILSGRTLTSENGSKIKFGKGVWCNQTQFKIPYQQTFSTGRIVTGFEVVSIGAAEIFLDQFINNVLARRYIASIEGPLNVLRIRPVAFENSNFISRECIRRSDEEGSICYVKVKYRNDVIVTVFKEHL